MTSLLPLRFNFKSLHFGAFLLMAAGLLTTVSPARAQEPPPPPPPPHHEKGGQAQIRIQHLTEVLGLNADQQAKVIGILQKQMDQMRALRDDDSQSREEKGHAMRKLRDDGQAQIRALLTAEQQKKFDAMPKPERRHRRPEGEAPASSPAE